jgi:hypothetical protein
VLINSLELSSIASPDILGERNSFYWYVDEAALADLNVFVLADDLAIAKNN